MGRTPLNPAGVLQEERKDNPDDPVDMNEHMRTKKKKKHETETKAKKKKNRSKQSKIPKILQAANDRGFSMLEQNGQRGQQ